MTKPKLTLQKALPYILVIGGIIGLLCSFALSYDKLQLLQNPHFVPNCNINPIVSCGSVMSSHEGSIFGFPNSFIGLAAYGAFITIGMAMLAGAKFKRWFWLGLEIGTVLGIGFVHWLFYYSVYVIHALCPYCIVIWLVSIITFWYVTLYNIDQNHIRLSSKRTRQLYGWIRKHQLDLLLIWLLIIAGLILKHFWYYYGHYF